MGYESHINKVAELKANEADQDSLCDECKDLEQRCSFQTDYMDQPAYVCVHCFAEYWKSDAETFAEDALGENAKVGRILPFKDDDNDGDTMTDKVHIYGMCRGIEFYFGVKMSEF